MNAPPNARAALGGIWRLTYPVFVTPFRLGMTLAFLALYGVAMRAALAPGSGNWLEVVIFYATLLTPGLAFLSGAWALREAMGSATGDYVLTRPLSRRRFVLLRYVTQFFWIELGALCALAVLASAASSRGISHLGSILPWLALAQFLGTAAAMALGFLCAAITNRYLIVGLAYAGTIEAALGNTPIQLNQVSMLRHVRTLVMTGLDAQKGALPSPGDPSPWAAVGLLAAFTVFVIALAAYIFSLRQFTGAGKE